MRTFFALFAILLNMDEVCLRIFHFKNFSRTLSESQWKIKFTQILIIAGKDFMLAYILSYQLLIGLCPLNGLEKPRFYIE